MRHLNGGVKDEEKRSYSDSVHFYGIIWDIAALLVFMMIPVSICLHLNVWPEAKYILKGLLPVAMIFYPSAVIEFLHTLPYSVPAEHTSAL